MAGRQNELVVRVQMPTNVDADRLARQIVEVLRRPPVVKPAPSTAVPDSMRFGVGFVPGFYP